MNRQSDSTGRTARASSPPMTDGLEARRCAAQAYLTVTTQRKTLESALDHSRGYREMEPRDRAFARAILATTFRRHGQTLNVLKQFLAKPLEETHDWAAALLVTGTTQLLWMDVPPHAAVSSTVSLAEKNTATYGLKGLINAILRKIDREGRDIAGRTAPRDNLPDWMARAWRKAYGPGAFSRMSNVLMDVPPLDLTVKDPAELEKWAAALEAEILPNGSLRRREIGDVTQLPGYREGAWWVQDAAASVPARLLNVQENEHVLDLCAAPGGKTLQLAAAGGRVTAVDSSESRMKQLRNNLSRTQLKAHVAVSDVRDFKPKGPADALLLDAPCTATGTLRRHPESSLIKRPRDVARMATLQLALAKSAIKMLRPGGRMVVCTCSLQPEEGEQLASQLIQRHAELTVSPIRPEEVPGMESGISEQGWLRLTPALWADRGSMDGFFVARFEKATG